MEQSAQGDTKKALINAGIEVDKKNLVITTTDPTIEGAQLCARELLTNRQRPTAIFLGVMIY
ncbi:hypothetical protein GCM10020331_098880 [Ectobacillus funiculus]